MQGDEIGEPGLPRGDFRPDHGGVEDPHHSVRPLQTPKGRGYGRPPHVTGTGSARDARVILIIDHNFSPNDCNGIPPLVRQLFSPIFR